MSKFTVTSQNEVRVGVDSSQCAIVHSQIDCDMRYFNISIQMLNNELANANTSEVQKQIENEFRVIFAKAKEIGWNLFDNMIK